MQYVARRNIAAVAAVHEYVRLVLQATGLDLDLTQTQAEERAQAFAHFAPTQTRRRVCLCISCNLSALL